MRCFSVVEIILPLVVLLAVQCSGSEAAPAKTDLLKSILEKLESIENLLKDDSVVQRKTIEPPVKPAEESEETPEEPENPKQPLAKEPVPEVPEVEEPEEVKPKPVSSGKYRNISKNINRNINRNINTNTNWQGNVNKKLAENIPKLRMLAVKNDAKPAAVDEEDDEDDAEEN